MEEADAGGFPHTPARGGSEDRPGPTGYGTDIFQYYIITNEIRKRLRNDTLRAARCWDGTLRVETDGPIPIEAIRARFQCRVLYAQAYAGPLDTPKEPKTSPVKTFAEEVFGIRCL